MAERLERGEVIHYPTCPFALPAGDEHHFLLEQRLGSRAHKNISYDPRTGVIAGFSFQSTDQTDRLRRILADFSSRATAWLSGALPRYACGWQMDRVSYRPEEEATRRLRQTARNDLLHVDAFPSRPTNGYRILRLFANINLTDPRVWVTTEPFSQLLARYGTEAGLPSQHEGKWMQRFTQGIAGMLRPNRRQRSAYDAFMLRFHNYLKRNDQFQEGCAKRFWHFQSGAAWMVMTDTASHAVLRGRFALEHSYFIAPSTLALPAESPPALLERICGFQVLRSAA
jgi:hypothetical protein